MVTTAFGVGEDFDETLLRRMADAGGGHFEFIESAVQIPDFVASEVGEALAITAREAVLVVEAGEGAVVESLNDYPVRRDEDAWRVEIGSLSSGQSLSPVLRVTFPEGKAGSTREVTVRLEDQDGALGRPSARATFTWAGHGDNDRQPRDTTVDRRVAALYAARAERDALERNRARDFAAAREIVERCIRHIRGYAGADPELRAVLEDLRQKAARYSADMDGLTRKTFHSMSTRRLKERHLEKARRRPTPRVKVRVMASADLAARIEPVFPHLAAANADLFGDLALDGARLPALEGSLPLSPVEELRLVDGALSEAVPAAVLVLFTTRPLFDNGSSHWHARHLAAVVSLAGWNGNPAVPLEAFVVSELILHGLRTLGPAWTPEDWMHADARGCLFDLGENREDLELKLQAADLCPSCRAILERGGVPLPPSSASSRSSAPWPSPRGWCIDGGPSTRWRPQPASGGGGEADFGELDPRALRFGYRLRGVRAGVLRGSGSCRMRQSTLPRRRRLRSLDTSARTSCSCRAQIPKGNCCS